jgi:uncharacterized protein YhbP (UPF0306 family)
MDLDIEQIVREYLDKTIHMSMATVSDNKPWVCEVHFTYDEDLNLYFHSKPNTRHCQEIANNPNVAGNIVAQHGPEDSPHGIYFEGTAEADETEGREDSKEKYKITVDNWYAFGKFGGDTNHKYKLTWNGGAK